VKTESWSDRMEEMVKTGAAAWVVCQVLQCKEEKHIRHSEEVREVGGDRPKER